MRRAGVRGRPARLRARRDPAGQRARLLRLRGEVPRLRRGRSCPPRSPPSRPREVRRLAVEAFEAASCEGLARVDFFLLDSGEFVINEINTMPGFTPISMYPRMWQESGVGYAELVDRLIQAALRRPTGCADAGSRRRPAAAGGSAVRPRSGRAQSPAGTVVLDGAGEVGQRTVASRGVLLRQRHLDVGLAQRRGQPERRRPGRCSTGPAHPVDLGARSVSRTGVDGGPRHPAAQHDRRIAPPGGQRGAPA